MQKKHILKALSLLAAVCITAGCNGNATAETTTTTATTTAEITTVTEQATITTEDVEETNGIKYCEIPEGMTFEDLCTLGCYNGQQIKFPCTLDEILSMNNTWVADTYGIDGNKSSTWIVEEREDDNSEKVFLVGVVEGDLNSSGDINNSFSFKQMNSFSMGYFNFHGINYGDNLSKIKDLLGEPSEDYGYNYCYKYLNNGMLLMLEVDSENEKFVGLDIIIRRFENEQY